MIDGVYPGEILFIPVCLCQLINPAWYNFPGHELITTHINILWPVISPLFRVGIQMPESGQNADLLCEMVWSGTIVVLATIALVATN